MIKLFILETYEIILHYMWLIYIQNILFVLEKYFIMFSNQNAVNVRDWEKKSANKMVLMM